jgi:hypothetical protein
MCVRVCVEGFAIDGGSTSVAKKKLSGEGISLGLFDINQTANVFFFFSVRLPFTVICCAAGFTISKFDDYITIISARPVVRFLLDFKAPPT